MTSPTGSSALSVRQLSITLPDRRALLANAELSVEPGTFVLLVGPSGSGKTTLLRLIAGLDDPAETGLHVSGTIETGGSDNAPSADVGLVFQNHALFDELSAKNNVQIAIDHRPRGAAPPAVSADELLAELNISPDAKPTTLSGGERQRVAVARTLAMDPPVLLFDEPTTGLDPARARQVVELIVATHRRQKTIIVVTHDYAPFLACNPRLVLLDSSQAALRDVDAAELSEQLLGDADRAPATTQARRAVARGPLAGWVPWIEEPGRALIVAVAMIGALLSAWPRPKWKLRYLWYYLKMVTVGTTAVYVAIAGAMLGFVFVNFSFAQIPYSKVTVPLLTEEFLAATGYSTYRVIVPLLIAILVAGKCGASIAADVGTRRYTHQIDAMRNCRIHPEHYLYGNIALSLILGVPLLTIVAYGANCYASLVAFLLASPDGTVAVFRRNYFATIWPAGHALPTGTGWMLFKMATSGMVIAALSYAIGSRRKSSPADVSRDVGLTIFWASLGVLLLHSFYSRIEF
ncbi:MAG: ATP-binding cassette domain-containing protein [Phycisphaerae bacterium]